MHISRLNRPLFGASALCALAMHANACVELSGGVLGTYATNRCPYPVNISWCTGSGCVPPPGVNSPLNTGFTLHLTNTQVPIEISYCRAPTVPKGQHICS
jgi:hypothetical protein